MPRGQLGQRRRGDVGPGWSSDSANPQGSREVGVLQASHLRGQRDRGCRAAELKLELLRACHRDALRMRFDDEASARARNGDNDVEPARRRRNENYGDVAGFLMLKVFVVEEPGSL